MANNHFNYQNSSITETSRVTINSEQPVTAPAEQNESSHFVPEVKQIANGQQKNSKTCGNGEVDDMLNHESTDI